MEKLSALAVMSALSNPIRYDVYRLLARALPGGVTSGELATATDSSPSTMSAHLAVLERAGLVGSEKVGRNIVYRAIKTRIAELGAFLNDGEAPVARNGPIRPRRR